jgi:hypothetical protein
MADKSAPQTHNITILSAPHIIDDHPAKRNQPGTAKLRAKIMKKRKTPSVEADGVCIMHFCALKA